MDLHRRYRERTVRAHMLELELARAQLQFLELQLQPHFLFNCLNAISELAHEEPDRAEHMLRQLHTLLRLSLERAGQDEVSLDEELASLEPYFDIQRTRFSEWLQVAMDVEPSTRLALVPHFILQPLVENSIRHGLAVRSAPGTVTVRAWREGERLRLQVIDDGVGLMPKGPSFRPGIGLRNARNRLTQLYGEDHRFELRPGEPRGTVVDLEIPWRSRDLVGQEPVPDWSATGEWNARPTPHLWSTPIAGTPVEAIRAAVAARRAAAAGGTGTAPVEVAVSPAREYPEERPATSGSFMGAFLRTSERAVPQDDEPADLDPAGDASQRAGRESPRLTWRAWVAILGVWFFFAAFWIQQVYAYAVVQAGPGAVDLGEIAAIEFTSAGVWALLTPLVLFLARRFRVTRRNWGALVPLHVVAAAAMSLLHIAVVRTTGLLGEDPLLSSRYFNPLIGNVFIYAAFLAWSHVRDFYAWQREREVAASKLEGAIARSRYQTLCVQLRPQFLLGTLDLLQQLVHEDVPRAERLIARLADVLRLTLDAAGERETSLRREIELLRAYVDVHRQGIRPATRLVVDVPPEALGVRLPNRLLRTLVDDLLGGTAGDIDVLVLAERLATGGTQIRLRATAPDGQDAGAARRAGWNDTVEAAALAERDRRVSLFFPDAATAIVVLAEGEDAAPAPSPALSLAAQPA
jgi:LytS/YehU family sensor histidine kinase